MTGSQGEEDGLVNHDNDIYPSAHNAGSPLYRGPAHLADTTTRANREGQITRPLTIGALNPSLSTVVALGWGNPDAPTILQEMEKGLGNLEHLLEDLGREESVLQTSQQLHTSGRVQQHQNYRDLEQYLLNLKTSLELFRKHGEQVMMIGAEQGDEEQLQRIESLLSLISYLRLLIQANRNQLTAEADSAPDRREVQIHRPEDVSDMQTDVHGDSGYASVNNEKHPAAQAAGITSAAMPAEAETPSDDEARTVYSDASSVPSLTKESYLCDLADNIFESVFVEQKDETTMERVSSVLSGLLQAFALKVGHDAPSQMHRDVMTFVHKHRSDIVDRFRKKCLQEKNISVQPLATDEKMSLEQLMALWTDKLDKPTEVETEHTLSPAGAMHLDEDNEPQNNEAMDVLPLDAAQLAAEIDTEPQSEFSEPSLSLTKYRDFVFGSPAYQWLLENLHKELTLVSSEPRPMESIRHEIMEALYRPREISKRVSAPTFTMELTMEWDLLSFIVEQAYSQPPDEVLGKIITITGSDEQTQALPCEAYLAQTWPSTGTYILQLMKDALVGYIYPWYFKTLPDGTRVSARFQGTSCIVTASGPARSIAEVGEQVAWLGAGLRSSPYNQGPAYCTPMIVDVRSKKYGQVEDYDILLRLDFVIRKADDEAGQANGNCWYSMFRNPIIVKGYPILRRLEENNGLEISLDLMAGLLETCYMNHFNEQLVLKGFSSMLILTQNNGETLSWHLICNKDGERVSYVERAFPTTRISVGVSVLKNSRHVVGWCSDAQSFVGSADADYGVGRSSLPQPQAPYERTRASIHAGLIVTGTEAFETGHKDTPSHVSRQNGYILKLRWLAKRFVVLWDEDERRGWLVNGTSALLHILRASLQHDGDGEFKDVFLFKQEQMAEPTEPHEQSYAIKVLLNSANRMLKLYPRDEDSYIRLEDRVQSIYNVLEQLMDHQTGVIGRKSSTLYDQIEGWDFKDLTTDQDPFHLRIASLNAYGQAWVQLLRDIGAITLFGRGFGNLIQPTTSAICDGCTSHWTQLPKEKYYLAATVLDMKKIVDLHGSDRLGTEKLTDNLIWHDPGDMLMPCQCRSRSARIPYDPVQVLVFSKLVYPFVPKTPEISAASGAIILGQNSTFTWHGPRAGFQPEGETMSPSEESDAQYDDSGIGKSVASSVEGSAKLTRCSIFASVYRVGIVCALHKELLAVRALFDSRHENDITIPYTDTNHYALGRIGQHDVVAACLPAGGYGTNSAADVVSHMVRTFTVKFCLLVGIGGGVPSKKHDVRLGDVVVSQTGVYQYDLGKRHQASDFEARGILYRPPRYLMTAISSLEADPDRSPTALQSYIDHIGACRSEYKHPGPRKDKLFAAEYAHQNSAETCAQCNGPRVQRKRRPKNLPKVHYGLIASGNQVMGDAITRDKLAEEKGVLCFEMEAAGVMDTVDCLVIRGICDYADSHKNDIWQEYASATAAAYAKLLLSVVRPERSGDSAEYHLPVPILSTSEPSLQVSTPVVQETKFDNRQTRSSAR